MINGTVDPNSDNSDAWFKDSCIEMTEIKFRFQSCGNLEKETTSLQLNYRIITTGFKHKYFCNFCTLSLVSNVPVR